MGKHIDLTGMTFYTTIPGKPVPCIKVIQRSGRNHHHNQLWKCECLRCGNLFDAQSFAIKSGNQISCGCWNRTKMKIIKPVIKHNMYKSREYACWKSLLHNHYYPHPSHKQHQIDTRWLDFETFLKDVGRAPSFHPEDWLLVRVGGPNSPWCKENCQWSQNTNLTYRHVLSPPPIKHGRYAKPKNKLKKNWWKDDHQGNSYIRQQFKAIEENGIETPKVWRSGGR